MEEKSNWFVGVFSAFRSAPAHFIIFVLVLIAGFLVYVQHDKIMSSILVADPKEEAYYFEQSIKRDILINTSLQNFLTEHKAKNAVIVQYHNGQYDLTNIPFQKISVTYYVGESIEEDSLVYNTSPVSSMAQVSQDMWKPATGPACVSYRAEEIPDLAFKARVLAMGYAYTILCPIENIREYPIGYVGLNYDFIPENTLDIKKDLADLSIRVAGYLQEGKGRE